MSRKRSRFAGHAFHHVAIPEDGVNIEIENVEAGTIEIFRQPFSGNGHSDAVACALPQRSGRSFHPGSQM